MLLLDDFFSDGFQLFARDYSWAPVACYVVRQLGELEDWNRRIVNMQGSMIIRENNCPLNPDAQHPKTGVAVDYLLDSGCVTFHLSTWTT